MSGRGLVGTRSASAVLLAILLPPLGLHLAGVSPRRFWTGVMLTVLGFVPGAAFAVHAALRGRRAPDAT